MQETGSLRVQLHGTPWISPLMRVHSIFLSLQSLLKRELRTRFTPHLLENLTLTLMGWSEFSGKLHVSYTYAWCSVEVASQFRKCWFTRTINEQPFTSVEESASSWRHVNLYKRGDFLDCGINWLPQISRLPSCSHLPPLPQYQSWTPQVPEYRTVPRFKLQCRAITSKLLVVRQVKLVESGHLAKSSTHSSRTKNRRSSTSLL